jgi:hypothetical protein
MRPTVSLSSLGLAALLACVASEDKKTGFEIPATAGMVGVDPFGTTTTGSPLGATAGVDTTSGGSTEAAPPTTGAVDLTSTSTGAADPGPGVPEPPLDDSGGAGTTGTTGVSPPQPISGEGQLCFDDDDCPGDAPYCNNEDHKCHDGSPGDPCDDDDDCAKDSPSCVYEVCYVGNDGDPCKNDHDCAPWSPNCVKGQCWDGQEGDPCNSHKDCAPFFGCDDGVCKSEPD